MANIILIEPDKVLAGNVTKFLKSHGHKITWLTSAPAAIQAADKLKPDAIILDLQLSRHSGIEFLHEFRSYADWQDVPVVIYSSVHPDSIGGPAVAVGLTISAYVHKPSASLADLADAVNECVAAKESELQA